MDVECRCMALGRRYLAFTANMNQPTENQPTFNTCNSSCPQSCSLLQMINTAARLVRAHLDFCTWGQTQCLFAVLKASLMLPLHCVINREVFALIFAVFNRS